MKRVVIFISLVFIIFAGCTYLPPLGIRKDFKYCLTREKTGLDTLIDINGYYAAAPGITQWNGRIWPNDTLIPAYVFYDNGFVFKTTAIDNFIKNKKIILLGMVEPGGYILRGDTIKLQYVNAPGGQSRDLAEMWFKIIDRNTIERIETEKTTPLSYVELPSYAERIYIFRPLEINVKPEDTWIYNKNWFRCKKK